MANPAAAQNPCPTFLLPPGARRPLPNPVALTIPLFAHSVHAGFPSPADDYVAETLDLNEHLIAHKEATFFLRASGHSMIGAGIQDGDLLVVDRSVTPRHRSVVIAVIDGEFTVKRLFKRAGRIRLLAENPDYPEIDFADGQELQIWGVVTSVIHRLPP
ncbi:MAG: translesion error-prone DNA polymerase V autoproteolytic subunit [Propionivibrio sp.]